MSYQRDSWVVSTFWGRTGAAITGLAAFFLGLAGYSISEEDITQIDGIIMGLLGGISTLLVIISKVREARKLKAGQ